MVNFGSAISGLRAASLSTSVTANNLANVSSTGFKESRVTNAAGQGQSGVVNSAVKTTFSQGAITTTGNSLDVGINGEGFLSVTTPQGTAYTRSGSLQLNNQGVLTDNSGNPITPQINVPGNASSISINSKGNISGVVNGRTEQVGQLNLTKFTNSNGLNALGNGLYGATAESGQPLTGLPDTGGRGTFIAGGVEASNVDIASNIVNLIIDKNAFKANTQTITVQDEMIRTAIDIIA